MTEIARTKELHRELLTLRQDLQKKLADEAARQKELSVASEITDDKGDQDSNQIKKYQRIVKSLSTRYKPVEYEEIKEIAYKLSIRLRVLRIEMPNILKVRTILQVLQRQFKRQENKCIKHNRDYRKKTFRSEEAKRSGFTSQILD